MDLKKAKTVIGSEDERNVEFIDLFIDRTKGFG